MSVSPGTDPYELQRRNIAVLSICQALLLAVNSTVITLNGLAGFQLATNKSLATLPVTCWVLGGAVATFPASFLMKRIGRRKGFLVGSGVGLIGTAISAMALSSGRFWELCVGTLAFGMSNAFGQYFRFAAADAAHPRFRARAISLVLAGGLVGGFVGPNLASWTIDLLPTRYLASYLSTAGFLILMFAVAQLLRIPPASDAEAGGPARSLVEIAREPRYFVAVIAAATSYGVMNLLMTATPLAMGLHGHPFSAAAGVTSAHIVAMYAPSLVTGDLMRRIGVVTVMLAGAVMLAACAAIALLGITVGHFWTALVLLGVGWNCLYVGATALLTTTYRPSEKAKAQGANEIAIFLTMVTSSTASGLLLERGGWTVINWTSLPFVAFAAALLGWLAFRQRQERAVALS